MLAAPGGDSIQHRFLVVGASYLCQASCPPYSVQYFCLQVLLIPSLAQGCYGLFSNISETCGSHAARVPFVTAIKQLVLAVGIMSNSWNIKQ